MSPEPAPTTITAAELEAQVIMATLGTDIATRRATLVDALVAHYPHITGLDPYADMLLEALAACHTKSSDSTKLTAVRAALERGHSAAYDLRDDIWSIVGEA